MSLWDKTPATLTSFTPLSSEVQASGNFITRWLRKGKDESDQSSDGGGSQGHSRETSVDRDQSREQSLERRISQQSSSRASLIDGSQGEPVSESESSQSESSKKLGDTSLERSESTEASKRTLRSVITRLSAILERRTATPQVYRDSDFKQYWMPDSSCRECYDCGDKFTTFRRRHHCRICGQIFCNACCNQELPGKIIGYKGSIRVCDYCCQVAQRFAQKADPASDPKVTKEVLRKAYKETDPEGGVKGQRRSTLELMGQLRLRSPGDLETSGSLDSVAPFDLTPQAEFVSMDMTERRMLTQDSAELRQLWNWMLDPVRGVEFQNYRIRLRTYQRCVAGNKLVDWLLRQDKVKNRIQAIAIGQALIDADLLDPILNVTTPFRDDFTLYRPAEVPLIEPVTPQQEVAEETIPEDSAPLWFQEIQTSTEEPVTLVEEHYMKSQEIGLPKDDELKSVDESKQILTGVADHFDEPLPNQNTVGTEDLADPLFSEGVTTAEKSIEESTGSAAWRTLNIFSDDKMEKSVFDSLQHEHHDHLTALTKQLLGEENLPTGWADIIISTVDRISLFVKPDIKNSSDDMDIRQYVHLKKIPGGRREQTGYVHGVIFKKNVAHKKMAQHLSNPRTLLMNGCIEYQRVENKMSSLQPQILQEEEFLRKGIAKIAALKPKPDILIVEKSVSRLAQDFLLQNGITLVYNVKMSVMERLSRFLQADIVPSIDSLVTMPALGFCHTFSVANYALPSGETKTMLCFDGCATHLGCSITLRGGSLSELKKVKKVMNFMIYASYHSRLEISFCMDEYLMPPPRMEEIDFDLESIKYNRKYGDTDNQQGIVVGDKDQAIVPAAYSEDLGTVSNQESLTASSNVKHVIVVPYSDAGSGDNETKDSDKDKNNEGIEGSKELKDVGLSDSGEIVSRIESMEKDLLALERDIDAKEGNSLKTAGKSTEATNKGAMITNTVNAIENKVYTFREKLDSADIDEPSLAKLTTLQSSGDKIVSEIDIDNTCEDTNGEFKNLTDVCGNKVPDNEIVSATTKEPLVSLKEDKNIDTPVNMKHSTGDGAMELKVEVSREHVDARDHKIEDNANVIDVVLDENKDFSKISTEDTLNKGDSVQQSNGNKVVNRNNDGLKLEIHLKPTCDSGKGAQSLDLLKLRSVSSPNFEKSFPFASDELNHRTTDIKAIDNIRKSNLDVTKTVLKSCMSEAVIKSDKVNHSKADKSPSLRRKVESTCLTDQSDPLQSYQKSHDDSIFQSSLEMAEQKNRFKLKKALENVILSVSPYIHYDLPYLETEQGSKCELRRYFPEEIYWSHHFSPKTASNKRNKSKYTENESVRKIVSNVTISKAHELIRCKLNMPATDPSIQTLIAKFRAYGGRINVLGPQNGNSLLFPPLNGQKSDQSKGKENQTGKVSSAVKTSKDSDVKDVGMLWERKIDCLDPVRHQRIAVLFSSFSYASENHPSPCVYPWVVTMEFYGRNDITLGGFLERFCFRPSYECPSDTCSTAMVDHIRRFAHGTGSISIVLKKLNHLIQNGQENILIWSWCHKCKQVTPVTAMSTDTWNMSFAKYLEMRFHGSVFQRRASAEPCGHSLHHDHFQYFGFRDTVASFKYAPIKIKEIKLPPFEICCMKMVETIHLYRMSEFNKTLLKQATEMYSRMLDGMTKLKAESSCETLAKTISNYILQQQTEKTHMRELAQGIREKLHVLLKQEPDKKIQKLNTEQYKLYTDAEDGMVLLKKMMAEAVANWNNKIQELYIQQTKKSKQSGQKKEKDKESGTPGSLTEIREKETGTPSSFTQGEEDVQSAKTAEGDLSPTSFSEKDDMSSIVGSDISSRRTSECTSYIRKVQSTTSLDSYTYGVTPGISAVWPSSPRSPDSFVVCHRDQVPPIDFEQSAEVLDGVVFPSLTPQPDSVTIETTDPVAMATTDSDTLASTESVSTATTDSVSTAAAGSKTFGTSENIGLATTDPVTIATTGRDPATAKTSTEPTAIATTETASMTTAEPITIATAKPTSIPQTSTEEPKAPDLLKEKVEATEGNRERAEVKDKAEAPKGDQKLAVLEPVPIRRSPQEDQTDSSTSDKLSAIKKTLINSIWQAPVAFQQQMPFDACDHHLLPPCAVVPVVVYDHEPSSIIAYSLSCHDYHSKLQEIQTSFSPQRDITQGTNSSSKSLKPDPETDTEKSSRHDEGASLARRPSSGRLSFFRGSSREPVPVSRPEVIDTVRYIPKPDALLKESPCDDSDYALYSSSTNDSGDKSKESANSHIEIQFSDSIARFYCKVYFAEQFRQLRKQVLPDGEDVFIRSLSRCRTWEAKGGKSGSSFRKTIDDRFILKQMSSMEVESFEKFGPQYFQYIYKSEKQQRPSALAKIVGVYRIGFRNQQTNNAMKQDLLVVENLFYNRNISQTYDLKGSERNRLVKTKSKRGEEIVLLDENFLRASVDCPLYILPHSKTMLTLAISHDSQFLSSNLVMDYSLLVGVDEEKRELVVGIIDYIRTFTWDKKLETILKSNFGGQGKMPTVVSPEVYRTRFLDMMGKYFLAVPDQWSSLGRDVDS